MRYDCPIVFVRNDPEARYDPETGTWIENLPDDIETEANVTDLGTDRSVVVFGDIKQGAKVIRTQPLFDIPEWDFIKIEETYYQMTTSRNPLFRNSLIVEEIEVQRDK